ncbi:MAG: hypothetical protein AABY22_03030 [Nanoarchaeota archaeon]
MKAKTDGIKKEIERFKKFISENRKIRNKLRYIAGWTADDFEKIINLLKQGEEENIRQIKELKGKIKNDARS